MKHKIIAYGALCISLIACVGIIAIVRNATFRSSNKEVSLPDTSLSLPNSPVATSSAPITPETLLIPSINVSAHIQDVGISIHKTMAVPTNYTDVGWYRYGPLPGSPGNAVIDGHLDNGFGLNAVFKNLGKLKPGDDVYVVNASGTRFHFEVTSSEVFNPASSTDAIFGPTTGSHLNLITCEGVWEPDQEMYSNRLVVFTNFIGVE